MAGLSDHLKFHYLSVCTVIGGVNDNIDSYRNQIKMINEKLILPFQSKVNGLEFIVLYDNSKYSDRYKNRVFEFLLKFDTEAFNNPECYPIIQSIAANLAIIFTKNMNTQ